MLKSHACRECNLENEGLKRCQALWSMAERRKPWIIEMSMWEMPVEPKYVSTTAAAAFGTVFGTTLPNPESKPWRCWCWRWCWHPVGAVYITDEKEGEG